MSSREEQVLERQRQMAKRLAQPKKGKPPPPPTPGSRNAGAFPSAQRQHGKGRGGSSRSLASLTGAAPKSPPPPPSTSDGGAGGSQNAATNSNRSDDPSSRHFLSKADMALARTSNSNSGNSKGQKRPSIKKSVARDVVSTQNEKPSSHQSPVTTAEMAILQARQRAGVKRLTPSSTTLADKPPKKPNQLKRPAMRRAIASASTTSAPPPPTASGKSASAKAGTGSLTSLLLSNSDTAKYLQPNAPKLLKHYRKIEPADYWRSIREWDFLEELSDKMGNKHNRRGNGSNNGKRQRASGGKEEVPESKRGATKKLPQHTPIPDTFDSYREYCALWAPLCLDEARAQLLSDAVADVPYWKSKPEKRPVRVRLRPQARDVDGSSESLGLRVEEVLTLGHKDRGFIANDIVLLAREEACIWDAAKGTLAPPRATPASGAAGGHGLVGHVEFTRRSAEGATVQVSRKQWADLGNASEMTLLKIGANVTSLREFTALCRMDSIPLLDYILGRKMAQQTTMGPSLREEEESGSAPVGLDGGGAGWQEQEDSAAKEKRAKKAILSSMGGSSALGKGFAKYASTKFNVSQLEAISTSSQEYGSGGFTLIKGPPGTGKTTTLCALLNALHIRQMNQYFHKVKRLAESYDAVVGKRASLSLSHATKMRPRILVCAPSNAAVDNVILKIMEDGFVDGNGCRYNPSVARIGRGQSLSVKDVCLEEKVESYISDAKDLTKLEQTLEGFKAECRRIHSDITKLRQRMNAIKNAASYPLAKEWEIRIDEETLRVYFVNHREKMTTFEVPPPPEPGQRHFPAEAMPEYKAFLSQVVKLVERYNNISTEIERYSLCQDVPNADRRGANCRAMNEIRQQVETHILDASIHIVTTTLGTAGNRSLEAANKFEVVVIDEAAQSVEPSTLVGLQLGSKHCILVGDPQQLPATIFNVSGRNSKYDRSLFQRLEEAGHDVHLLNTQYRMHPAISDFPRRIFYDGKLMDGSNVKHPEYGNPLKRAIFRKFQAFQAFTVLDLESSEERGGTSLANSGEAQLALHLFNNLKNGTDRKSTEARIAVITPYAQQAALLRRTFSNGIGADYERFVEVSSVDAFQGREAKIVIFSCVRAAGSKGIGFLSDVRRMNVALTRAKHFLFVIARCSSITINPYWRDLVDHARETEAVIKVPFIGSRQSFSFPNLWTLKALPPLQKPFVYLKVEQCTDNHSTNDDRHNLPGSRGYQI